MTKDQINLKLILSDNEWIKKSIKYSNNEEKMEEFTHFNNFKITIQKDIIITEHLLNPSHVIFHTDLNTVIKEIEESRQPLFKFSMF